jgi:two-component system sensor histidine kinase QseC
MSASPTSLRRRLLVSLLGGIALTWLVAAALVYRAAGHEVEEVFDADLLRSAQTLQALLLHEVDEERDMAETIRRILDELGAVGQQRYPFLAETLQHYAKQAGSERLDLVRDAQLAGHRYGAGLVYVARYADGSVMLRDQDAPDLPQTPAGFTDVRIDGHAWRIYRLGHDAGGVTVQVAERQSFRDELVGYITRNTLMPLLVALPVLAVLIWATVGRVVAPLQRVADAVADRAPEALEPIGERGAPREIDVLVKALNALFGRVAATLERERQFTADAAHELRTPLAAMKTHLQVTRANLSQTDALAAVDRALSGVDRITHLVEQLLLLARADAGQVANTPADSVDLRDIAMEAVGLASQLAFERDIDLGLEAEHPVLARGDRPALLVLLRNLVDNAVRYTPRGGTVTVAVGGEATQGWCRVSDDGPGIEDDQVEQVFRRFHRGTQVAGTAGSGLGLSIVQRIARLHGADIELGPGLDGRGLSVTVRFPPV